GRNQEHFAELSARYRRSRLRAQRLIALYFPFVQLLSTVGGALILFVAAGEERNKTLTAGGLIAYLLYIDLIFSPAQQLSQGFDGYNPAAAGRAPAARRPPPGPDRVPWRAVQVLRAAAGRAVGREPGRAARRDRGPGRPDRRGQVHHGQAGRTILRRHVGHPAHRRH